MKVVIDNGSYHLRNMGDVAMLQAAATKLRSLFPDAALLVPTMNAGLASRYVGGTPLNPHTWHGRLELRMLPIKYTWVPKCGRAQLIHVERALQRRAPLATARLGLCWRRLARHATATTLDGVRTIATADLVVACGGGFLTDEFPAHALEILDTFELAQDAGRPTAMFSQGLGPVTNPTLLQKMGEVLPGIGVIAVREERVGVPLLRSLGVAENKIVVTGDDAIEPAYAVRESQLGDKIGVGIRVARYSSIEPEDARRLGAILQAAADRRGTSLRPIPIDWRDEPDSDLQSLRVLLGQRADSVAWPDDDTPLAVMRQVGPCRVVVTSSYHAGVFALAQGIPVVGVVRSPYYVDKFLGLADQFSCGCEVLALDAPDFEQQLTSAIDHAWQAATQLRPPLLAAAQRQIACAREAYARLRLLAPLK